MRTRTFIISLFTLLAVACQQDGSKEPVMEPMYFELNNAELENAIKDYQKMIFADNAKYMEMGDSVYVTILSKNINDSITRMVLSPIESSMMLEFFKTPFLVAKVNGHDVFIMPVSIHPRFQFFEDDGFLTVPEGTKAYIEKHFFPDEMKEKYTPDGMIAHRIYEPELCFLTFINDSLISKTFMRGVGFETVPVKLNGKEVYM